MNKREIVTSVLQQIFEYHYALDTGEFATMSLDDSEDFDSDTLYGVWEDVSDTFSLSQENFGDAADVPELIDLVVKHWDGQKLDGVNKDLQWTPLSERSMPEWEEENPEWTPWTVS